MALHGLNNLQGKKSILFLLGSAMLQAIKVLPSGHLIPLN